MADFVLSLGSVQFQDFEIPSDLASGVAQAMAVRKYAGGQRTIDTLGPDDKPLKWSGTFLGQDSQDRSKQLEAMARQGVPVTCTWASKSYLVIIAEFDWQFRRFWEISYSISLEVVQNNTFPQQQASPNADSQMNSDLSDAGTAAGTPAAAQFDNETDATNYSLETGQSSTYTASDGTIGTVTPDSGAPTSFDNQADATNYSLDTGQPSTYTAADGTTGTVTPLSTQASPAVDSSVVPNTNGNFATQDAAVNNTFATGQPSTFTAADGSTGTVTPIQNFATQDQAVNYTLQTGQQSTFTQASGNPGVVTPSGWGVQNP